MIPTLHNASVIASGALGLRAGLGEGKDRMEQGEMGWDEMWPTALGLPPWPCVCFEHNPQAADVLLCFRDWSPERKVDS